MWTPLPVIIKGSVENNFILKYIFKNAVVYTKKHPILQDVCIHTTTFLLHYKKCASLKIEEIINNKKEM